jgi:hypothetical protein
MAGETWKKFAVAAGVLALVGGAGKHVQDAAKDPDQVYGPTEFGGDVGDGVDDIAGSFGDAAGGSFGRSKVLQGGAAGAGAYGASKAWKKWGGRSKDDPVPVPEGAETPTLPGATG